MRPASLFPSTLYAPCCRLSAFQFYPPNPPFSAPCPFFLLFSILFHRIFCISFSVCAAIFIRGPGDTRSAITPLSRPAKLISVACPVDSDFCPRRISLQIVFPFCLKKSCARLCPLRRPFCPQKKTRNYPGLFSILACQSLSENRHVTEWTAFSPAFKTRNFFSGIGVVTGSSPTT